MGNLRAVFVSVLSAAWPVAAGGIGYAQATGYYKHDTRPTLYQPLNLLDARDASAWCSPTSDPLNELLTFGFDAPVTIEELRVSTGNNFDQRTWEQFGRARKLALKSGKQTRTISLEDKRGSQAIAISPPLTGARFTVEVLDQYPAEEDADAPTCLTDVVFISETKALNGAWLTPKLKFDKAVAGLMGTWFAGYPGTPDRFLTFNFDGTFRYSFEPFDAKRAQPKKVDGTYDVSSVRLVLEVAGKRRTAKYTKAAAPEGGFTLTLEGELPDDLKQPFRSVP